MPSISVLHVLEHVQQWATALMIFVGSAIMPVLLVSRSTSPSIPSYTKTNLRIPVNCFSNWSQQVSMPFWFRIWQYCRYFQSTRLSRPRTATCVSMLRPRQITAHQRRCAGCVTWVSHGLFWRENYRLQRLQRFIVRCPMSSWRSLCMVPFASAIPVSAMPLSIVLVAVPIVGSVRSFAA